MVKIAKNVKVPKSKKRALQERKGGSNVGDYKKVKKKDFAGPAGGAPVGSYPIDTLRRAKSALRLAHNAPRPEGIKKAVYKKYPELNPASDRSTKKHKKESTKKRGAAMKDKKKPKFLIGLSLK